MGEERNSTLLVQSASKAAMAFWVTVALLHIEGARAKTPVSIELVFAVDTSISVDGFEYHLMMKGIANAFRTPEIINLIGHQNGVAVAPFQWNSQVNEQYMIPWHLLNDPASVLSFAAKVEKAERDPNRRFTAIGGAIHFGVRSIAENAFEGRQLKIDVSGDGRNNTGIPPSIPRQEADALGIVINGLPILTYTNPAEKADLDTYYREEVIHGPGAFIEIANEFDDFARAFLRKLRREITPVVSQENIANRHPCRWPQSRPRLCLACRKISRSALCARTGGARNRHCSGAHSRSWR